MKSIKKFVITLLCLVTTIPAFGAGDFYFKGNFVSGNIWTCFLNMGITTLINRGTQQFTYDNQLQFGGLTDSGDNSGKMWGFSPFDLFSNYGTGVRLGYKTRNRTFLNFTGYGNLDYKIINNHIWTVTEQVYKYTDYKTTSHNMQIGAGGNVVFGKDSGKIQLITDIAILYDLPFGLSTDLPDCELQSGMSSRYGLTVVFGNKLIKKFGMNLGFWAEVSHHNYFKSNTNFDYDKYKYFYFGFNFTICPWKL